MGGLGRVGPVRLITSVQPLAGVEPAPHLASHVVLPQVTPEQWSEFSPHSWCTAVVPTVSVVLPQAAPVSKANAMGTAKTVRIRTSSGYEVVDKAKNKAPDNFQRVRRFTRCANLFGLVFLHHQRAVAQTNARRRYGVVK